MAGIKYLLQKEIFDATNERILSVCNVQKLYKKKRNSYLCIVTAAKACPTLVQVKQNDKGIYRKKRAWQLAEIKSVDGKSESTTEPIHEFDIVCDKHYKWFSANLHERQNFLTVLHKQCIKYVKLSEQRATFANVPRAWLQEQSPEKIPQSMATINGTDATESDTDEFEDFQALTEKEEHELNKLMVDSSMAVTDAEQFMEQLGQNLHDLDGANVQSILASEKQVNALLEQIEEAIAEANRVEARFDEYEEILGHVRDTMEKMGEKNTMIEVANNNNINLLSELERLVAQLDLPQKHQVTFTDTDLTSPNGLAAAIAAAKALQAAMNCDIDPVLLRLTAVQDQKKRCEKWKAKFLVTVSRHLNNMFIHLGNDLGESQLNTMASGNVELVLMKHGAVHKELSAYNELMHWVKSMDRRTYDGLTKVYTESMSKVYERELKNFFDLAKATISPQLLNEGDMNTSISSKFKSPQSAKQSVPTYGMLGINKEQWTSGLDTSERQRFDTIMEKVLTELEPVALSEQHFCIRFFQMDVLSPTRKSSILVAMDNSMTASIGSTDGKYLRPFNPISGAGDHLILPKTLTSNKIVSSSSTCNGPNTTEKSRSSNKRRGSPHDDVTLQQLGTRAKWFHQ